MCRASAVGRVHALGLRGDDPAQRNFQRTIGCRRPKFLACPAFVSGLTKFRANPLAEINAAPPTCRRLRAMQKRIRWPKGHRDPGTLRRWVGWCVRRRRSCRMDETRRPSRIRSRDRRQRRRHHRAVRLPRTFRGREAAHDLDPVQAETKSSHADLLRPLRRTSPGRHGALFKI